MFYFWLIITTELRWTMRNWIIRGVSSIIFYHLSVCKLLNFIHNYTCKQTELCWTLIKVHDCDCCQEIQWDWRTEKRIRVWNYSMLVVRNMHSKRVNLKNIQIFTILGRLLMIYATVQFFLHSPALAMLWSVKKPQYLCVVKQIILFSSF